MRQRLELDAVDIVKANGGRLRVEVTIKIRVRRVCLEEVADGACIRGALPSRRRRGSLLVQLVFQICEANETTGIATGIMNGLLTAAFLRLDSILYPDNQLTSAVTDMADKLLRQPMY